MGWGHMWYGWFFWIIILVLLVFIIIRLVGNRQQSPTQNETPLDVLKKRYANGEITKEQFEEMKRDLR